MNLVHTKTQFIVATLIDNDLEIHDPFIRIDIQMKGIMIPPFLRNLYKNQAQIKKSSPDFLRAFQEVYVKFYLHSNQYHWEF